MQEQILNIYLEHENHLKSQTNRHLINQLLFIYIIYGKIKRKG